MNVPNKIFVLLLLAALFPIQTATVDSAAGSTKSAAPNSSSKPSLAERDAVGTPVYRPPLRGAPAGRVGGGTRGATERESFALQVLTPEHPGFTSKEQPCLYWFISKPVAHLVEMTITERKAVQPLFIKAMDGPVKGGIQEFCLAGYGVELQREVPYKWFVALVTDKNDRSKDILAGGMIQRIDASTVLQDRLTAKTGVPGYFIYAEEGYWLDSLESITKAIERSSNSENLIMHRAALLKQVGLTEVADAEAVRQ